jgi:hypothetical protein
VPPIPEPPTVGADTAATTTDDRAVEIDPEAATISELRVADVAGLDERMVDLTVVSPSVGEAGRLR